MKFRIKHLDFEKNPLEVEVNNWNGTTLYYQGQKVKKNHGKYVLQGESGASHDLKFKSDSMLLPQPYALIDGEKYEFMEKITGWYRQLLIGLPLLLLFGGALGGLIGAIATAVNTTIFRKNPRGCKSVIWAILVICVAGAIYVLLVLGINTGIQIAKENSFETAQEYVDDFLETTTLPMAVDQFTILTGVQVQNGNMVYEFEVLLPATFVEEDVEEIDATFKSMITTRMCKGLLTSKVLEKGINIEQVYILIHENGDIVSELSYETTEESCKGLGI